MSVIQTIGRVSRKLTYSNYVGRISHCFFAAADPECWRLPGIASAPGLPDCWIVAGLICMGMYAPQSTESSPYIGRIHDNLLREMEEAMDMQEIVVRSHLRRSHAL